MSGSARVSEGSGAAGDEHLEAPEGSRNADFELWPLSDRPGPLVTLRVAPFRNPRSSFRGGVETSALKAGLANQWFPAQVAFSGHLLSVAVRRGGSSEWGSQRYHSL